MEIKTIEPTVGFIPKSPDEKVITFWKPTGFNWSIAISLLTVVIAVGAVTLHLIGEISHRQYLAFWGIDSNLFPKTADWVLINGYYGVVDRFVVILLTILVNWYWMIVATAILGIYVFFLSTPASGVPSRVPKWFAKQSAWRQRLVRQMLLTALFVSVAPCALFLLTAFTIVPVALGETAGRAAAETGMLDYKKGCGHSKNSCVELKKDGLVVAVGFVLDSSSTHIALFDTQIQRGRVLALDNLEVVSNRTPATNGSAMP